METTQKKSTKIVGIKNAGLVIICCFIIAVCIYHFILGNPTNFMNNDPNNHPLPGNFMGTIYKGGVIVPVIQTSCALRRSPADRASLMLETNLTKEPLPKAERRAK